jgi:hypothetical protein
MGILTAYVIIAFFLTTIMDKIATKFKFLPKKFDRGLTAGYFFILTSVIVLAFYLPVLSPDIYGGRNLLDAYKLGWYFESENLFYVMINIAISFGGKIGILLPIGLVTLVTYPRYHPKGVRILFVLVSAVLIIPLLPVRLYAGIFILPLICPFIGLGVIQIMSMFKKKKVALALCISIILVTMSYTWVLKDHWSDTYAADAAIDDGTFSTGLFMKYYTNGTIIVNQPLVAGQLRAASEQYVLPLGGSSMHWRGPEQLNFGFVSPDFSVSTVKFNQLTIETDWLYSPLDVPNAQMKWERIMWKHSDDTQNQYSLRNYNVSYAAIDSNLPTKFNSYGRDRTSLFVEYIHVERYKIFDNGREMVFFVQV